MAKFCENGHPMEQSWALCPDCRSAGFQLPVGRTDPVVSVPVGVGFALRTGHVETSRVARSSARSATGRCITGRSPLPSVESDTSSEAHVPLRRTVGWLVALDGPQQGEDFRIRDGENIIGCAADADIQLRAESVSGRHASVRYSDGRFALTDLDSQHGTFLNEGSSAISRAKLEDNDVLRLGRVSLKFKAL